MSTPTAKEKKEEVLHDNLLSGLYGALIGAFIGAIALVVVSFIQVWVTKEHHKDILFSSLIPEITSGVPARVSMAFDVLREKLDGEKYDKYWDIVDRSITEQINDLERVAAKKRTNGDIFYNGGVTLDQLNKLKEILISYKRMRSDWKASVEKQQLTKAPATSDAETVKKIFFEKNDEAKKLAPEEIAGLLSFAEERVKLYRCEEAVVAMEMATTIGNEDSFYDILSAAGELCPIVPVGADVTYIDPKNKKLPHERSIMDHPDFSETWTSRFRFKVYFVIQEYLVSGRKGPPLSKILQIAAEKKEEFVLPTADELIGSKELERVVRKYRALK